jgi:hypothetical protein
LDKKQDADSANQTNIFFCEKLKSFRIKEFEKVILKLFTTSILQPSRFCSTVARVHPADATESLFVCAS